MKNKNLVLLLIGIISIATITMSAKSFNKKPTTINAPLYLGQPISALNPRPRIEANWSWTFNNNTGCNIIMQQWFTVTFDDGTSGTMFLDNLSIPAGGYTIINSSTIYNLFGKPGSLTYTGSKIHMPGMLADAYYKECYPNSGTIRIATGSTDPNCNCFIWIPDYTNMVFTINPC